MTNYFVWTANGPQLWYSERHTENGKVKPHLFIKTLDPNEENLTLDQLAMKYKNDKPIEAKP